MDTLGTGTYSPEDNKLRLYPFSRLSKEDYARVRAAGFIWAPKQELFVAPMWTPERADFLEELCGEIEDEDKSLVERSEERAERFEDYSDKRREDADRAHAAVEAIAGGIPMGQPILVGHHSERRARRDAEKIQNGMSRAVKMWETSKYWEERAQGAIRHAKHKERPDVRARRIKGLEADKRRSERTKAEAEKFLETYIDPEAAKMKLRDGRELLPALLGTYEGGLSFEDQGKFEKGEFPFPEALARAIENLSRHVAHANRWIDHISNRIAYERAMMGEAGGIATDRTGPEKGGACKCWASPGYGRGWSYIQKVNRVSVTVLDNFGNSGRNFTRTIPFDKLRAVMTKKEVDEKREAGLVADIPDGTGFYLKAEDPKAEEHAAETRGEMNQRAHEEAVQAKEDEGEKFQAMRETLKAGIQVVSAPELFVTPPELAERMVEEAEIESAHRVLEPSAGTGNLLRAIGNGPDKVAVELNSSLVERLAVCGVSGLHIHQGDFLQCNGDLGKFDRVLMNPPFSAEIDHVLHAYEFLNPGGRIVAIMSEGPFFRSDKKSVAFRAFLDEYGRSEKLPADTFKVSGTGVNTRLVVIDKE